MCLSKFEIRAFLDTAGNAVGQLALARRGVGRNHFTWRFLGLFRVNRRRIKAQYWWKVREFFALDFGRMDSGNSRKEVLLPQKTVEEPEPHHPQHASPYLTSKTLNNLFRTFTRFLLSSHYSAEVYYWEPINSACVTFNPQFICCTSQTLVRRGCIQLRHNNGEDMEMKLKFSCTDFMPLSHRKRWSAI